MRELGGRGDLRRGLLHPLDSDFGHLTAPQGTSSHLSSLKAHVVAHTHWDREWYHPFVRFRQRLVALIDELLDNPPAHNESFLLDGQAIILEDYLGVRPERAAELSALLQEGRLEAGPWYVLADELTPGGEALVRNLLVGRRVLRRLRAAPPPVLYCPDSFGHPAVLPSIAAGFALPVIILWRGLGSRRWPPADTVIWRAPDGESAVVYHLPPNGYEFGSQLPLDASAARRRWESMRAQLGSRSATGVVLVPNGADHHARQTKQRDAVEVLATAASAVGDTVDASSLGAFVEDLLAEARGRNLPIIQGELRDSYGYTWTLQGTFASRASQKRANARAERLLVRDAEPWAALAWVRGTASRHALLVAAWRTLLQAHPHDTLCGCSIDAVADAMDRRLADTMAQATGIRDDAIADWLGHDAVAARSSPTAWKPVVIVRNRAPRPRGGVAMVEIEEFLAHVPVGPGSGNAQETHAPSASFALPAITQVLEERTAFRRTESPQHYPDNDLVLLTRACVWMEPVPAYGIVALLLGSSGIAPSSPRVVRVESGLLDNGIVRVIVMGGRVSIVHLASGREITNLLELEDRIDRGDLYTPSIRGTAAVPEFAGVETVAGGPLLGELRLRWRLRDTDDQAKPSSVSVYVSLVAESPLVGVRVAGVNRRRDHRLRLALSTDVEHADVWADAAFGPVRRVPLVVPNADLKDEVPPATAPLHRSVSLFAAARGATLFSDGLAEYEATSDGKVFVTLVRAVGELSRSDLPERPGHAGWPTPTPKAQSLGPFGGRFAVLLHGPRNDPTIDEIERTADDVLLPLEGRTLRSALAVPPPHFGVELHGAGLAFSALKESDDGDWLVARCVNLLDSPVDGFWRFGFPIHEARVARLDETAGEALSPSADTVRIHALPRSIVTVLVR